MIDMESRRTSTDPRSVPRPPRPAPERVGRRIQAYLRRTADDVRRRRPRAHRRLVKGAYLEPADVAYRQTGARSTRLSRSSPRPCSLADARARRHARPRAARRAPRFVERRSISRTRVRVPDAVRHPPRPPGAVWRRGRAGSGLRPVRHRVVPVPHSPPGRAACQHVVLRVERVRPVLSGGRMSDGRDECGSKDAMRRTAVAFLGGGRMGEALVSGLIRSGGRTRGRDHRHLPARGAGARARRALRGHDDALQPRGGRVGRDARPDGEAPGHGGAARADLAGTSRPSTWSSASRRASGPRSSRSTCPDACPWSA